MAIPTWLFEQKFGVALMRYQDNIGEWFFEGWVSRTAHTMNLPVGSHSFHLWLICPNLSIIDGVTHTGWSSLAVINLAR